MPEQHRLTAYISGSWKEGLRKEDGEIEWRQYDHRTEVFVEAECSCGQDFDSYEKAHKHIRES